MCGWEEHKQMMQRMRNKKKKMLKIPFYYFKMKENCTKIVGTANGSAI
jgi:hypothetical protein